MKGRLWVARLRQQIGMRSAAMHTTAHGDAPQKTFFIVQRGLGPLGATWQKRDDPAKIEISVGNTTVVKIEKIVAGVATPYKEGR